MKDNIREWIKAVVLAAAIAFITVQFILPTTVHGVSMEPTFEENQYLLINKQSYFGGRIPQRGDVIVFNSRLRDEQGEIKKLIKRVIAVPGDSIEITNGRVYINGEVQEESYLKDGITNGEIGPVIVPEDNVFCMGDNRLHSTDSRFLEVGFIEKEAIIGKVFFRVLPFSKFGKNGSF